jgi:hypothetical protein
MRLSRRAVPALALAAALVAVSSPRSAGAGERIVNGLGTQDFATTGALLYSGGGTINENNAYTNCSGTLIGCSTFLTAAHCVADDAAASHYLVYLQHGGLHAVSSVTYNPAYGDGSLSGNDVAIVKLAAPVEGIDPTVFNSTHDLFAMGVGRPGVIAGFGQTSGTGNDYGVKRYGDVVTANCTGTAPEGNDVLVCWDYTSPVGPAGTDSNTCNGDSGGPLFMDFSGTTEIVAVTSGGSSTNCLPTDHSYDASVYHNRTWIDGQLGADATASCGGLAPVGDPSVTVHKNTGTLGSGNLDDYFEITLTGTPALVRFTLNGTDDSTFNPNIFVKQGAGASAASYACKGDGTSVFGACQFANPAAGTWSVFVQRGAGSGEYQATTTVWGDPPVCGNNLAEFGEACDGSDLGTCPVGPCTACACPPPVCGNNVIESGEDCDGTSDAACDGLCSSCSCPPPVCGNNVLESGEACDGTSDAACPGLCLGDCSCYEPCTSGKLYGFSLRSDLKRFLYKALVFDSGGDYADLDPRDAAFELDVEDSGGAVHLAIPAMDAGWIHADPVRRKYGWKGDGSLDGLRRVKLQYKDFGSSSYWALTMKGSYVTGASTIVVDHVLHFRVGFDGTCHLQDW